MKGSRVEEENVIVPTLKESELRYRRLFEAARLTWRRRHP